MIHKMIKKKRDTSSLSPCRTAYTTEHELKFINNLGKYSRKVKRAREQLLINYIITSMSRHRWGEIDSNEVQSAAILALTEAHNNPG